MENQKMGLVYAFTGEGKGKTSAALGMATRALLLGEKVVWVAFFKSESWETAEKKLPNKFDRLTMVFSGRGFMIRQKSRLRPGFGGQAKLGNQNDKPKLKSAEIVGGKIVIDKASEKEHQKGVRRGIEEAEKELGGKPFLLVMDEVLNAVSEGFVKEEKVLKLLAIRGRTHVILTGRADEQRIEKLIAKADLVTECKNIKHPYEKGILAERGLDY